MAWIFH